MARKLTVDEIADRIDEYFQEFERDPKLNIIRGTNRKRFFNACSWASGRWVYVRYIGYHVAHNITKAEAEKYLAWLDNGNVGKHTEVKS